MNLYDLDGRDVCAPTPFGDACAGDAVEDALGKAEDGMGRVASSADDAWDWTAPGRTWVSERAQDLAKSPGSLTPYALLEIPSDVMYKAAGKAFQRAMWWAPERVKQYGECGWWLAGGGGSVGDCDPFELLVEEPEGAY